MSSPTGSSQWLANPGGDFYNGVALTSLRFNRADSPELSYTPSASNRKTYTLSVWVKLGFQFDQYRAIFGAGCGGNRDRLQIMNNQTLVFNINDGTDASLTTNALIRDTSAWYHIVAMLDTTQSTDTNRMKLYINGTETTYSATSYPDEDYEGRIATNIEHFIGNSSADNLYFDGYLAEFNYTDGVANTPDAFGETKNGVWIPKEYSGSYGQNGFRMKFDQVGVGTAGTSTIGADTSGLTNHLTSTNIVAADCAQPDSPENNFCTLNPIANLNFGSNHAAVHSEGNVKAVNSGTNVSHLYGTFRVNDFLTDGCYFEAKVTAIDTSRFYFGIIDPNSWTGAAVASYQNSQKAVMNQANSVYSNDNVAGYVTFTPDTATTIEANTVIGVAVKGDDVWFHVNGVYTRNASDALGNPSTGANPAVTAITDIAGTDYFPYFGYASAFVVNFGQDPSFANTQTAGTETPDEGAGVFKYAVPTGFKAICAANLSDDDFPISPNQPKQADDYFETVLYEGDGSTQNIAVNFKPDWTWIKNREATDNHQLFDSNRGVTKVIESNTTAAEAANDDTLTAFISTGFSLGDDVTVNTNNESYVSWNWKAGGTPTADNSEAAGATPTAGSVKIDGANKGDALAGSIAATRLSASTKAGFSIVTYTGTGSNATVGHGLDNAPEVLLVKSRETSTFWMVYHIGLGANTSYMSLNTTLAVDTGGASIWNSTTPSDSVFSIGTSTFVNPSSDMVAYCFHSVDGYSKMGSYTGNGEDAVDGKFVYLGFRPAWVMIKRKNGAGGWHILDNKRAFAGNEIDVRLEADNSDAENTGGPPHTDFLSNGFKLRTDFDNMNAASIYIYMAFAEAPFKYANAR